MSDRGPETLDEGAILLVTSKIRLYVMADALCCYTREIRVRSGFAVVVRTCALHATSVAFDLR